MAVMTITKENFEEEVLQAKEPVLLDFWGILVRAVQDGCAGYR